MNRPVLKPTFAYEATRFMTVAEIAQMLDMPTSFPLLLKAGMAHELHCKNDLDTTAGTSAVEILKFVPEKQPVLEDGRVLTCRDFWLQIHIKGARQNPVTAIQFIDREDGRYEVASAYLTKIDDKAFAEHSLHFRPGLGHHIIEQVDRLAHSISGRAVKLEPPELFHS